MMGPLIQSEEDRFHDYEEPITKVPTWLKEASAELEKAKKEGKRPVTYAQAVECGVWEKTSTQSLSQPKAVSLEMVGCKQMRGIMMGEVDAGMVRSSVSTTQAKIPVGVAWSELKELRKRHERAVNLSAFNAKQELRSIREWLGRLRGEVDAGIVRLGVVLSNLKETGQGQGSRETGRIHKLKRNFKPKKKYWARKKRWIRKVMGESSGCGPNEVEAPPAPERPRVVEIRQREMRLLTNSWGRWR